MATTLSFVGCTGRTPGVHIESLEQGGTRYNYAVFVPPGTEGTEPMPGLLFLHGRGESGTNGTRQLVVGLPKHALWDSSAWRFIIVMPQKPTEESQWEDHADAVLAMLDAAERKYGIDPARVALTGLSQGGHGCWTIHAASGGRFAALAPVCGYAAPPRVTEAERRWSFEANDEGTKRLVDAASKRPVWIFHGADDPIVPVAESVGMHEALRARGADARLSLYPGVGHDAWDRAYSDPALRAWLEAHTGADGGGSQ